MEDIGKINEYVARGPQGVVRLLHCVNLAVGTTPFIIVDGGVEHTSNVYRLTVKIVTVTHAFYRPSRPVFDRLHPDHQDHVLHGGLCFATLKTALANMALPDSVKPSITWADWCHLAEGAYGRKPVDHNATGLPPKV